jgi:hypothetical protein
MAESMVHGRQYTALRQAPGMESRYWFEIQSPIPHDVEIGRGSVRQGSGACGDR